jgi:hypothetical protein
MKSTALYINSTANCSTICKLNLAKINVGDPHAFTNCPDKKTFPKFGFCYCVAVVHNLIDIIKQIK